MESQQPQLTGEQYINQLKQGVYAATGALSTQISNSIDQIVQQWQTAQKTVEYLQGENDRLRNLLEKNKISSAEKIPENVTPSVKNKK